MVDYTIRAIKNDVLTKLSMLGGADTQYYAEAKLTLNIRMRFEQIFKHRFWERHCGYPLSIPLNTATGEPTVTMSDAAYVPTQDIQDIQWVMRPNETRPLPIIPTSYNPNWVQRYGFQASEDPTKLFRILPVGDTSCLVRRRRYTTNFDDDLAVVPFDSNAIICGVTYDILNGLGTNSSEEDSALGMYNQRIHQLELGEDQQDHFAGSMGSPYSTEWMEVGY